MVAVLKGDYYGLHYELGEEIPNPRVLYIDTEMEKSNSMLVMLRVYDMMGWEPGSEHDDFRVLWLREEVKSVDRWRKVLKAINVMRPTICFLDGLIDVVSDFNDNVACQEIIYKCMATASHYGISLWLLLHQNPGSEKMVGHAGSFLERKATDVLKTKKEKADIVIFNVDQIKARARDLDKWQFRIEDDEHHYGHPVLIESVVEVTPSESEIDEDDIRDTVLTAIGTDTMSKTSLRERIVKYKKEHGIKIGNTKATDYITRATNLGFILKDGEKFAAKGDLFDDSDGDPF